MERKIDTGQIFSQAFDYWKLVMRFNIAFSMLYFSLFMLLTYGLANYLGVWEKKLPVPRRTFIRHFSQATGMNFGEWLTTERLWQVQDLLENTDLPIERIAEQSGFGSAANLRLQFKAKFKINPNAWRKVFGR